MTLTEREELIEIYHNVYKSWTGIRPRDHADKSSEELKKAISNISNWMEEEVREEAQQEEQRKNKMRKLNQQTHPTLASIWPHCTK